MEDNINILNLQSNNNKKDEKDESNKKKAIIRTKAFAENHAQYLHVENGYRVDYTLSQSVWSIFQIHNETVNVWVHMLGACIFLYFPLFFWYLVPLLRRLSALQLLHYVH